jgi:hypothetical protein
VVDSIGRITVIREQQFKGLKHSLIIIILLIGLSISACTSKSPNDNIKRISAMEKLEMANSIAQNWNNTSFLIQVAGGEKMDDHGKAHGWGYTYVNNPENKNMTQSLDVIIYSNDSSTTSIHERPSINKPITNWTIDSNSAIDMAKSDNRIKSFLSNHPDSKIDRITFNSEYSRTNGCIIGIRWIEHNISPIPLSAALDGNTGQVIEVE